MDSIFLYPMTLKTGSSSAPFQTPVVTYLPSLTPGDTQLAILSQDQGQGFQQGLYLWIGNAWRFTLPYSEVCDGVIKGASIVVAWQQNSDTDYTTPQVTTTLYRNGVLFAGAVTTGPESIVWGVVNQPNFGTGNVSTVDGIAPDAAGNVVLNLTDLPDVDVREGPSINNYVLSWNQVTQKWIPVPPAQVGVVVRTVSTQAPDGEGNVTVEATDANIASGVSLISDSGATSGNIKFKRLVAGSGIILAADANGNLEIDGSSQYTLPAATSTTLGGVIVKTGLTVDTSGDLSLLPPTGSDIGGVKAGTNVTIAADGTISSSGAVQSVSGQTGAVVIQGTNNNGATGTSLITDSGATTGTIKFKTIVAGTNVALVADPNGNLQINNTYVAPVTSVSGQAGAVVVQGTDNNIATGVTLISDSGATTGNIKFRRLVQGVGITLNNDGSNNLVVNGTIASVSGQTGAVVIQTTNNNAASGTSLITDTGATTGVVKLKTLVAGTNMAFAADGNGNIIINSTATSGALTAVNSEGTGTSLVDNNGTSGGIATIKSLAAGSNVTITASGDGKTLTVAANQVLNPATSTTIGGVIVKAGLSVDGSGNLTLVAPTGVNLGGVKAGTGINIAADGTISVTAPGGVTSVSGQTGAVVVQATNNNAATGTSLIVDSGATNANIKLKTIVAGTGITLANDANNNLQINSTATGGVSSITAGASGALTGAITFTAGQSISLSNTGNSIQINGTGVPEAPNDNNLYARQNMAWTVIPSTSNPIVAVNGQTGTGAILLVEDNPPANTAVIKSLVAGNNVTITESNGLLTIAASIPSGTVSTVNGQSPNTSGAVTLTAANVNALPIAGGTMTGTLNVGSQTLTGLIAPVNPSDAVPYSFLTGLVINGGVIG